MRAANRWVIPAIICCIALGVGSCNGDGNYIGPYGSVKSAVDLDGQASLGVMKTVDEVTAIRRTGWELECQALPSLVEDPGLTGDEMAIQFCEFVTEGEAVTTLTISGELWIDNGGSGDAPIESIIVNLQTKPGPGPYETASSVACGDPTQLCNASGPDKVFLDNAASGDLVLLDGGVDICDDLPVTLAAGDSLHLEYTATFIIDSLGLDEGDQIRCEALVTFSNAGPRGGSGASCPNPQEPGDFIRTVASRVSGQVPPIEERNQSVEFCKVISGPADPGIVDVVGFDISTNSQFAECTNGVVPADGSADFCCVVNASGIPGTVTKFILDGTVACLRQGRTSIENTATITGSDDQVGIDGSPAICEIVITCGMGGGGGGQGDFCTQTQGGWGTGCAGMNPGCLRDAHFDAVFPGGLVVGGTNTITLTSAAAVEAYLPAGGTPAALTGSHVNPLVTESGVLGGQVVALTLNVEFDAAGFGLDGPSGLGCGGGVSLGELVVVSGSCQGMTVQEVLDLANAILGGDSMAMTPSQINECAANINQNFVDCVGDNGFLACP